MLEAKYMKTIKKRAAWHKWNKMLIIPCIVWEVVKVLGEGKM
jgi:hypothetical protein